MTVSKPTHTLADDLRTPQWPLHVTLILLGAAICFAADALPEAQRDRFLFLGLWLILAPLCAWLLSQINAVAGRWLVVGAMGGIIVVAQGWLRAPGLLALLMLPVAAAGSLVSVAAGFATALAATALVLALPGPWSAASSLPPLAVIWATSGVLYVAHLPVRRLREWLGIYLQQARNAVEELRNHKAETEQLVKDLASANRQLALANARINALREVAEDAQRTKSAFVAKVSHEFRTPLNMIIGLVELMLDSPHIYALALPPDMEQDLEVIRRNCRHLSSLVDDVLDLTRVETGRLKLHIERVNLQEVVQEAAQAVQPLVRKKGLTLDIAMPPDLPVLHCDRTRIRQVILNLLSNAARFVEVGGIRVAAVQQESKIVVSVSDTGPGIAPQDIERIFEPFCQGSATLWRDKGGSGLGLSVSQQFIKLHHGRMWVESVQGVGSTFRFELPIYHPNEPVARSDRWLREDWVWRERVYRSERARQVEQSRVPRVVVCDATGELTPELARYGDALDLVSVQDMAQVAEAVRDCPAHLVLVNAATGEALWPLLAQTGRQVRDTPVLGCALPHDTKRALAAGARGQLIKPVSRADLARTVAAAGQQADGTQRPVRRVLIVDDDVDVQDLFTRMLQMEDTALEVLSVSGGEAALATLRATPVDLVLLDTVMPGLDGWQVLAALRQDARLSGVPVYVVSAQDPLEQPPLSPCLLATMGEGLSISRVLNCSLELAHLLLQPDRAPDPELAPGDAAESVWTGTAAPPAPVPDPLP